MPGLRWNRRDRRDPLPQNRTDTQNHTHTRNNCMGNASHESMEPFFARAYVNVRKRSGGNIGNRWPRQGLWAPCSEVRSLGGPSNAGPRLSRFGPASAWDSRHSSEARLIFRVDVNSTCLRWAFVFISKHRPFFSRVLRVFSNRRRFHSPGGSVETGPARTIRDFFH